MVCTILQGGGRNTIRASSLAAVLFPEDLPDFALLHDEGRWKGGEAMTGVQMVKPGIEAIQLVGQLGVVVWGSSTLPLVVKN